MAYTVAGSSVITDSSDGILNTIQLSPTTRPPVTTRKLYDSDGTLLYNGALIGTPPVAPNWQYFTSPGTYTASAGVTGIRVEVVGGGGGTQTYTNPNDQPPTPTAAGAGGGSALLFMTADSAAAGPFAVTVGTKSGTYPGAGGTSSFGSKVSATGGQTTTAGSGTGGDINTTGSPQVVLGGAATVFSTGAGMTVSSLYGSGGTGVHNGIVVVEEYF